MAARCASCSYPLSVSDSVSCCECLSYFHIDCAQLVGFPYYELSSDPVRNTFHCQTCKILPLPTQSVSFSDSDSDDECAMPSRQLEFHSEGQPDFAKDMNEVKGTVQDLSELCKDMFREINELKSINLTLRCCVENLRHDGEQRDGLISDLTRRIEALEGKRIVNALNSTFTKDMHVDKDNLRIEEEERYSTPDPEYCRLKELENFEQGNFQGDEIQPVDEIQNLTSPNFENRITLQNEISERKEDFEPSQSALEESETEDDDDAETEVDEGEKNHLLKEIVNFAEEEIISLTGDNGIINEDKEGCVKDWSWKGNNAIPINEDENGSSDEEENETSDTENIDAQGWENLDEDMEPKSKSVTLNKDEEYTPKNAKIIEESDEVVEENSNEEEDTTYSEEEEIECINVETEETIPKSESIYLNERAERNIEPRSTFEAEETEETKDEAAEAEVAERTSLKEEERVSTPKPEGEVIEIVEGEAEIEDYIKEVYTGRVENAEGSRLEVEPGTESVVPVGEAGEGGQSPEVQGEVQPSELSENSEPPPPPPPQHSPDDLWEYLKETVTGEHPATVEEFVQKLIGTLEHVPEEYLKPVIDYNIKRAVSPSVTDGEHIDAKDGEHPEGETLGVAQSESGEVHPQENGEVGLEGQKHSTSLPDGETRDANQDGVPSGESAALQEESTYIPEDPSADGYTAVEAAS